MPFPRPERLRLTITSLLTAALVALLVPTAASAATPDPRERTVREPGWDISWPQCGNRLPEESSFTIVGVTGGRPMRANRCLGAGAEPSQLEWAGRWAQLYINTANPGPEHSSAWPRGQRSPRACDTRTRPGADTIDCAYDYGWNTAQHAYRTAVAAYVSLGWAEEDATRTPAPNHWWLDVETHNTWRSDRALNVAVLRGAVDFLESVGVGRIGFYSTQYQWNRITGGSHAFADHPAWHAGATTRAEAIANCEDPAFTGGRLVMTQYFDSGFDANYRCR